MSSSRSVNVITIGSVTHNGLNWLGGTGHWYHFSERILPALSDAYDLVWGPQATSVLSHDEVYIVFEEVSSVDALGPFGRFFLTSVLTGGKFNIVYLCSARHILSNDKKSLLAGLKVN